MEEYNLISKISTRTKGFKLLKDESNSFPFIDAIQISYKYFYKRANKPVMKSRRVESFEDARKEYKKRI